MNGPNPRPAPTLGTNHQRVAVWLVVTAFELHRRSYSPSTPVSTETDGWPFAGIPSWYVPATRTNSVSYPVRDGNWVPGRGELQCITAVKVMVHVGLASQTLWHIHLWTHWPKERTWTPGCCPVSERLAKQTERLVLCAVQILSD